MEKYLDIIMAFAETMRDKYIAPDNGNHLLFIARDPENTIGGLIGRPKEAAESLYGICMKNEGVRKIVLAVARKLGGTPAQKEDGQADSQPGFIESVEFFADTMMERYHLDNNNKLSLVLLAGNEDGVQLIGYGDKTNRLISMATAISTEDWFKHLVKASMALAKLSNMDSIKDIIEKFNHDTD